MGKLNLRLPGTLYGSGTQPIKIEDGDFSQYIEMYEGGELGLDDLLQRAEVSTEAELWAYVDGLRIKNEERERVARDVEEFLNSGGTITVIPEGVSSGGD